MSLSASTIFLSRRRISAARSRMSFHLIELPPRRSVNAAHLTTAGSVSGRETGPSGARPMRPGFPPTRRARRPTDTGAAARVRGAEKMITRLTCGDRLESEIGSAESGKARSYSVCFFTSSFGSFSMALVRAADSSGQTELEIVVLRHQLRILKRRLPRAAVRPRDQAFLAAVARYLPGPARRASS